MIKSIFSGNIDETVEIEKEIQLKILQLLFYLQFIHYILIHWIYICCYSLLVYSVIIL